MKFSSIRVKKYKLFDEVMLSELKRVNIVIGKNNSGKRKNRRRAFAGY